MAPVEVGTNERNVVRAFKTPHTSAIIYQVTKIDSMWTGPQTGVRGHQKNARGS